MGALGHINHLNYGTFREAAQKHDDLPKKRWRTQKYYDAPKSAILFSWRTQKYYDFQWRAQKYDEFRWRAQK